MFQIGQRKVNKEFNVVKIVQNLNIMKNYLDNNVINDKAKWLVAHSMKNTIDLDKSSDDFDDSSESFEDLDNPDKIMKVKP